MAETGLHISLAPEHIADIGGLPLTPSILTSWITTILILAAAFFIGRNLKLVPGKVQVVVETFVGGVMDYMKNALEDVKLAERYFPLIASIFVFVLFMNLVGFLPIMESVGFTNHEGHFQPLFYPVNADLNTPLALAIISFLIIEIAGIVHLGFLKYASKFVNFSSPMNFFVGILEIIGNLARLVSLSFRLFGNILAGHLLIVVLMFFAAYLLPLPFLFFEVFVAFIQAAIFSLLTLFFIKLSVTEPHGEEHAEAHA
jgi:F-type H+-transporting ATPase subunit a